MITDISINIRPEDEKEQTAINSAVIQALQEKGITATINEIYLILEKKSVDARHGQLRFFLRYKVYIGEKPESKSDSESLPVWKEANGNRKVIIVGSGPAGLFGALRLLESGIKPIIIERGSPVAERKRDIAAISTANFVNSNSNYCFGEGGAGTFSDGKLYTRSNKRGNINKILRIFTEFGAQKTILTDAHPHIGTDRLPAIILAMQNKITSLGGEFHFNTQCTDFIIDDNRVSGIECQNTKTSEKIIYEGDAVLLATGHSASDIYIAIAKKAPLALEAKTFAIGVRVEHPRELIDNIQYHGAKMEKNLGAAEYRLSSQENGRGVYSFCMCPGGFVVPAATGPDEIVINGMSAAARNSKWSNAAIVVETKPEDIPQEFKDKAEKDGCSALAGLYFRSMLEKQTKSHGQGQAAPAQRLQDFLDGKDSVTLPKTSYTPGIVASRLDKWLPPQISERLASAFRTYNKNMKGFIGPEALLIAIETRTSTPVRIVRDPVTFECTVLRNLYPAGEGAGYSGGIVSSAMDGEKTCAAICGKLQ